MWAPRAALASAVLAQNHRAERSQMRCPHTGTELAHGARTRRSHRGTLAQGHGARTLAQGHATRSARTRGARRSSTAANGTFTAQER